jgi:hypothetical protein
MHNNLFNLKICLIYCLLEVNITIKTISFATLTSNIEEYSLDY